MFLLSLIKNLPKTRIQFSILMFNFWHWRVANEATKTGAVYRYLNDWFFSHPEFITLLISVMNSGWQLSFRAHSDEHGTMKNQSLRYLNFSQYFHFFFFFELLPKHFCSYFQLIYFENYSKIYDLLEHSLKLPKCIPLIFHNLLAKCNDYQTKITNLGPFLFPQFPHCKSHGLRDWKYLHPNCVQSWSHEFFFEIID